MGGRPIKSKYALRISVRLGASGEMPRPCDSSFARTNESIGVRTRSAARTLGTGAATGLRNAQKSRCLAVIGGASAGLKGRSAELSASSLSNCPRSIHSRRTRISASVKRLSGSGRRHAVARDLANQQASFGESFHDHRAAVAALQQRSCRAQVETGHRLALSVALHAARGEDGENFLLEARALVRGLLSIAGRMIGRRAGGDPALQSLDVGIGNRLPINRRRHGVGGDFLPQHTLFGRSLHDHRSVVGALQSGRRRSQIEPQFRSALAVAGKTILLEDRQNVLLEAGLPCRREGTGRATRTGPIRNRMQVKVAA